MKQKKCRGAVRLICISLTGLAPLCLLCACGGRELTNVELVQTIAVDGAVPVTVTAAGEEETYRVSAADAALAQEELTGLGTRRLETTHIQQIVLGPEVDVADCLRREVIHRESGYGATVWRSGGEQAGELLASAEDLPGRLTSLEENAGVEAPTVLEALSDLTCRGRTRLPVLAMEGDEVRVIGYETVEVSGG